MNINFDKEHTEDDAQPTSLVDILLVLASYKKTVIICPILFGVIAVLVSFLLPNQYKTDAKILPPQQNQSTASAMLNQLGGLGSAALGVKNPNDTYVSMLKSRAIADKLIVRFNLQKVYNQKLFESTRKQLAKRTVITSGRDGIIKIEVEDNDPKLAKDLTNAYVEELVVLTVRFFSEEAAQRRSFYEKELSNARNNLFAAELSFTGSLEKNGMISVDALSKVNLETVARLQATITSKEVQLKSMFSFVTENNNDYKQMKQEIISMRQELAKLENGVSKEKLLDTGNKANSLKNIQILRDVKYHTMLYELLAKQYEVARLDESKNIPTIQVLDKAIIPERKFFPTRALFGVYAALLGLLLAIAFAFISKAMNAPQTPDEAEKWKRLRTNLRFR